MYNGSDHNHIVMRLNGQTQWQASELYGHNATIRNACSGQYVPAGMQLVCSLYAAVGLKLLMLNS